MNTIDIAALGLAPGEGRRVEAEVRPDAPRLGGHELEIEGGSVAVRIDLSRTGSGWAMRLAFEASVTGPCTRCLRPARHDVDVEAREVEHPGSEDAELRSPYVSDDRLDAGAWARDALSLALPFQLLCEESCEGLCAVCGEQLAGAAPGAHEHERPRDPRWAKLDELR